LLADSRRKLDRLYGALRDLDLDTAQNAAPPAAVLAALCDDLNTPRALAELFNVARQVNASSTAEERRALGAALKAGAGLLGIAQQAPESWFAGQVDAAALSETEIEAQIAARAEARRARDFAAADRIRDELAARGVTIEDSVAGTRWRRVG
jgi:cysteinyl-tRNA synthetase